MAIQAAQTKLLARCVLCSRVKGHAKALTEVESRGPNAELSQSHQDDGNGAAGRRNKTAAHPYLSAPGLFHRLLVWRWGEARGVRRQGGNNQSALINAPQHFPFPKPCQRRPVAVASADGSSRKN